MYRLLLIILSSAYCSAFAQEPLFISLAGLTLKNTGIDFHVERVIDARENKENIGYTQRGGANAVVAAYFIRPAEEELLSLFTGSFNNNESEPLIIRLDHLYIYEMQVATGQAAYAQLNLSFITKDAANNYYEQFQSAVLMEDKSGIDVTHLQAKNVASAVEKSIDDFMEKKREGKLHNKPISEDDLHVNPFKKNNYKVLEVTTIPKAVFHSFYDFRDYRPDTVRKFIMVFERNYPDMAYGTLKWADDGSKIKDAWGFSDGENFYIRINKFYYRLTRESNDFTIYSRYIVPGGSQGSANMGYMFGAVGGLIAGLISSSQSATGDFKCKVNFADGSLIPLASSGSNTFGAIYLYFTSYSQDGNISVFVNDAKKCDMTRDTYYRYSQNDGTPEVKVCLQAGGSQICDRLTSNSYNDHLYICKIKKGVPIFDKITSELQSTLLHEIYDGKYSKSCE